MKKHGWKRITSAVLALMMVFVGVQSGGSFAVSAQEQTVLIPGGLWSATWGEGDTEVTAELVVEENGFYTINTTNVSGYYNTLKVIDDSTGKILNPMKNTMSQQAYYFSALGMYTVVLEADTTEGTIQVELQKNTQLPEELVIGEAKTLTVNSGLSKWVCRFTASVTGDYRLVYDRVQNVEVTLIEEATGTVLTQQYINYATQEGRTTGTEGFVMALNADTSYVLCVNYAAPVLVEKCEKDVRTIQLNESIQSPSRLESDTSYWFNYTVIYTDGTSEVKTYDQICKYGYEKPDVLFGGNMVNLPAKYTEYYYCGGKQPCVLEYRGDYSVKYVTFAPTTANSWYGNHHEIYLRQGDNRVMTAVLKMEESGIYTLYSDKADCFSDISYAIVDHYYNPVFYNEKSGGFPLVGGQIYTVYLKYTSTQACDVWFEKEGGVIFPDTHPNGWYYNAMTYTVGRGAVSGYENGKFGPSDNIQRQDFLVMLARFDGVNLNAFKETTSQFPDVASNSYYAAAVAWGYESGIVSGYDSGEFGVGDKITREQMVTFLYRYAQYRLRDVTIDEADIQAVQTAYADYTRVSDFAKAAAVWAVDRGVITGKDGTKIAPQGSAQRCEVAKMMHNAFLNDIF